MILSKCMHDFIACSPFFALLKRGIKPRTVLKQDEQGFLESKLLFRLDFLRDLNALPVTFGSYKHHLRSLNELNRLNIAFSAIESVEFREIEALNFSFFSY